MQILMSVREGAMTAVRSVSTLLDHTTATVSVAFSWQIAHTVEVYNASCHFCESACIIHHVSTADVNECELFPNGFCSQVCVNTDGSFHCECRGGYGLFGSSFCTGMHGIFDE